MMGLLRYMKDLYIGPPRGKVCRIAPRNGLTAVPKIFFFCVNQFFLKLSCPPTISPKSFSLLLVLGFDGVLCC
jgi:hypothetical protein